MAGTRSPFREDTVVGLLRPDPGASGSCTEPSLTWHKKKAKFLEENADPSVGLSKEFYPSTKARVKFIWNGVDLT